MKKRLLKMGLSIALVSALSFMTACGGNSSNQPQGETSAPTEKTGETPTDPMAKYDPPIELTTIRSVSNIKFDEGESIDKNAVYDAYEKDLGIKIKNSWVSDKYSEKLKISIASNNIPDFFRVSASELQELQEADMIADVTDIFDKYATPKTKEWFNLDGGRQLSTATFDNRLMAFPATDNPYNSSSYLWIRKDWLEKLGLPKPQTMQDVIKIAEEFTKQDPSGTGKTYAFALNSDYINGGAYDLQGFFNGYHAYPGIWVKDSSGKLMFGTIMPEMKQALKQLQDMYKAGMIDPEFAVKDQDKENELVVAGKIGIAYGAFWQSIWPLQSAAVQNGKLAQDWEAYPIVSIDDNPAKTATGIGVDSYFVVSKKAKHPEAVMKIINKWIEIQTSSRDDNKVYMFGKSEVDKSALLWKINPTVFFAQDENLPAGKLLPKAIEAKDPSLLGTNPEINLRYKRVQQYLAGDLNMWNEWAISKPGGSFAIMNQYDQEKRYQVDEFYGTLTPAMLEMKGILGEKTKETFTKIIMNKVSVDEFDKFVEEWKKLGGEQMTKEANEWYETVKK
ncbi:extracellular solute-binding protein [Paenibacillus sp. KQZ6P-2]|uniref:Extracellular solute-binding protein n=1 Tax=Paenibacillus mangrovi TaxID=2931978 RepID=A0A9X1WS02_9BACL|nr:extracellular solute-binding protein [Paenibacillus mangrovi]MCJ8013646.1 extracellular solute-binding protein [Paenibacillus mangrovi]